jgi:hypothetical protein
MIAQNTPITNITNNEIIIKKDEKAWFDGDLLRLLVLFKYGGVWIDFDTFLIRDFSPLLHEEFVHEWDCFLPSFFPMNGAIMHFLKNSKFLKLMLNQIQKKFKNLRIDSLDLGSYLYFDTFKILVEKRKQVFTVLPWCFVDGYVCVRDNEFGAFRLMQSINEDQKKLVRKGFATHWHGQWNVEPVQGSLFVELEKEHIKYLGLSLDIIENINK